MSALTDMRLLVVDSDGANLERLEELLARDGYTEMITIDDPERVPTLCATWEPDLLLLDLQMPNDSGFEVMAALRDRVLGPDSLPVLVITAATESDARNRALSTGARDFVSKPIDRIELLLRVSNLLQTRQLQRQLADRDAALDAAAHDRTRHLEQALEDVRTRSVELEQARLESLRLLASVAEYHDDDTYQHTQRVGLSAAMIAGALGLPEQFIAMIRDAAALHDLGKIGISRRVLVKPGALTPIERQNMMRHVEIGARILSSARSPALRLAAEIALTHHERWDGQGYPAGLAGEQIPISGRIAAVADVFDALTHDRPYKRGWDVGRALDEIKRNAGTQFDPAVVAAFVTLDHGTLDREYPARAVDAV